MGKLYHLDDYRLRRRVKIDEHDYAGYYSLEEHEIWGGYSDATKTSFHVFLNKSGDMQFTQIRDDGEILTTILSRTCSTSLIETLMYFYNSQLLEY